MTLQVAQAEWAQLSAEWESLLRRGAFPTVFQTPLWHSVWWQELGRQAELRLASVREGDALVGVAPLMLQGETLTFLGDTDLWDYHECIVEKGREEEFHAALFDWLVRQRWKVLDLRSLPQGSPTLGYLPALADAQGYAVEVTNEDVSPGVRLPSTWDEYLEALSNKDRHELRRKLRRLESQGVHRWYAVNGAASLEGALEDFFVLMRDSRQDKAVFLTPQRETFFRRMAQELARAGILKLFFMELEGRRVAAALCFDYCGTRFLYNSGYNPEYGALSVGLLLKAMCLKQAIEEGKGYFDFLRGNERYKYNLGAKDVGLHRLVVSR
ncbi:MAG: GNAT family N-acetyltransferase [Chloroflexi bacterium]|nr:GNAT family N-acetyltransferase [Chloroflexota bacterium]